MDNIFFRFFIQAWPILLAAIASVALIYSWMRPKLTLEKLQKSLIRQSVLTFVGSTEDTVDPESHEWGEAAQRVKRYMNSPLMNPPTKPPEIKYRNYIAISLIWTLFWIGAFVFVVIRMILNPYYYGNEAIFLGYFAFYIALGLIRFFKR